MAPDSQRLHGLVSWAADPSGHLMWGSCDLEHRSLKQSRKCIPYDLFDQLVRAEDQDREAVCKQPLALTLPIPPHTCDSAYSQPTKLS